MTTRSLISKTASLALSAALAVSLFSPVPALAKSKKKAPVIDITKLAWPPPPDVARIRFVATYYGEDVQGIKKQGFLEKLAGVPEQTIKSRLKKPYGVAVDSKGKIYVTDTVLRVVFVFNTEAKELEYRGDKPPANLRRPVGVAVDPSDRLFVSDIQAHNINVFDAKGDLETVFGTDELKKPAGLAIDPELKRLYVADAGERKIAVYDLTSLKLLRWMGRSAAVESDDEISKDALDDSSKNAKTGKGTKKDASPAGRNTVAKSEEKKSEEKKPEEQKTEEPVDDGTTPLIAPTNLAVDADGLVYVSDSFSTQVVVYDTDGQQVRTYGETGSGPGHFMRPRGVAVDIDGHVYVVDAFTHNFQILTSDGKPLMPIGKGGSYPGQFIVPAGIVIDKNNRVIVCDQTNARIQIFRYVADAEVVDTKKGTQTAAATPEKAAAEKKKKK